MTYTFDVFIAQVQADVDYLESQLLARKNELCAAKQIAPTVNTVIASILNLMQQLATAPESVANEAKRAINVALGDVSLLSSLPAVSSIVSVVPEIKTEVITITENVKIEETTKNTNDVKVQPVAQDETTETDNKTEITPTESSKRLIAVKPQRRTQAGFTNKIKIWTNVLNNLDNIEDEDVYENNLGVVETEVNYWTEDGKFGAPDEFLELLQSKVVKEITEPVTQAEVIEQETLETTNDQELETEDSEQIILDNFLAKINDDNISEAGLNDIAEEIKQEFGDIPPILVDAITAAWVKKYNATSGSTQKLNSEDKVTEQYSEINEVENDQEDEYLEDPDSEDDQEDEYLQDPEQDNEEDSEQEIDPTIESDNKRWCDQILNNCETLETLEEWDVFIANEMKRDKSRVLPMTIDALDTTRERLTSKYEPPVIDETKLTEKWITDCEMAFDLGDITRIYNEIRESGLVLNQQVYRAIQKAEARLQPKHTQEEIEARASIDNQWDNPTVNIPKAEAVKPEPIKVAPIVSIASTTSNDDDFDFDSIAVEVGTSTEAGVQPEAGISISGIRTGGEFKFKNLSCKRFDQRYILEPGWKVLNNITGQVWEVCLWEDATAANPMIKEDVNKLPLKNLCNAIGHCKLETNFESLSIVEDHEVPQLIANYKAGVEKLSDNLTETGNVFGKKLIV